MSKSEDELRDILNGTALELAEMYENPRSWQSWLVYLLERLEERSMLKQAGNMETYKEMLAALQDQIRNRLRTGGW